MFTKDKAARRAKFEEAWIAIRDELLVHFKGEGMPKEAAEWYERVSERFCSSRIRKTISVSLC